MDQRIAFAARAVWAGLRWTRLQLQFKGTMARLADRQASNVLCVNPTGSGWKYSTSHVLARQRPTRNVRENPKNHKGQQLQETWHFQSRGWAQVESKSMRRRHIYGEGMFRTVAS